MSLPRRLFPCVLGLIFGTAQSLTFLFNWDEIIIRDFTHIFEVLTTFLTGNDNANCISEINKIGKEALHNVVCKIYNGFLCSLTASPGYRSRGPGSILGTTRFSEK
jgi:hypothetical protein